MRSRFRLHARRDEAGSGNAHEPREGGRLSKWWQNVFDCRRPVTMGTIEGQGFQDENRMTTLPSRSRQIRSSRKIASGRFRPSRKSVKQAAKPAREKSLEDIPAGTGQPRAASRENIALRLEGRRLGSLRGGSLRIVCVCGHAGDVPVAALVARHGEEARVRDAVASMRCGACGEQRVAEVRWLE